MKKLEVAEYFDELSESYFSDDEILQSYHSMRTKAALHTIFLHLAEGTIFDFGCGSGELTSILERAGYEISGCDISQEMVRLANEKLQEGRILHGGIECISRANLIVALNVCHYMTEEEETTFCTCARDNLADGGFLLIGHVNMLFDITTFNKYTVEFIATHVFPSLRSGNPGLLEKLKNLLTYPDLPKSHGSEREIVLQRRVDPFTYPATIERLGFKTCDFTPINSFPLPPLIIEKTPELILLQHKSQISNPTLAKIYSSQFQVLFQKTKGLDIQDGW